MLPVLHSMEVFADAEARALTFGVNLLAPSAIDQLRVVVLVQTMFDGERFGVGRFMRPGDKPFGIVRLRFASAPRLADAKAFCDAKLTKSGMMVAGERGLLDEVDPSTSIAASIMRVMYAEPFSDAPRAPAHDTPAHERAGGPVREPMAHESTLVTEQAPRLD